MNRLSGGASYCANRDRDFLIGTLCVHLPPLIVFCDVYYDAFAYWPAKTDLHRELHSAGED